MISIPLKSKPLSSDGNDLEALVRSSCAGNLESFNELVRRYYEVTFRLSYRMLGSREAAEDAVQEIFLKAWRSLPRFRGTAKFSTWLHSIAVNHCLSESRRQNREAGRFLLSPADLCADDPILESPSSCVEDRDLALTLKTAIDGLPEKLQVVVCLYFFAGYTTTELADALGLHPNTVRHRMNQAMKRLKRSLSDLEARS